MIEKLIRCTQCNDVIPVFGQFGDFGEDSALPGVEWSSEDLRKHKGFLSLHQNHTLEELRIDRDTFISERPRHEASKISYLEASNGRQRFLIRRSRNGLGQPAFYELIPGRLEVSNISLEIQENDLRRQMASEDWSFPLTKGKMEKFIRALKTEVKQVSPEEIRVNQEGDTPMVGYGRLKPGHWKNVLRRCQMDFKEYELTQIKRFIRENKSPNDVLGVLIKRRISILPSRGAPAK